MSQNDEIVKDLFSERITPSTNLPPMEPLFEMFGVPCFYRGELVADCGKAKSGKTTFLSILMAGAMKEQLLELKRLSDVPLKVLWIDTEQSQQSTQEIMKERIMPLAEVESLDDTRFYAFNLRGLGYEKRGKMVELAINQVEPDICILDGVKDLMTDINDATQATRIMENLMALAKENCCCIVCVLHQNKSGESRDPRGWLGTELLNKAFDVFATEKLMPQLIFKLEQLYTRKYDIEQCLYFSVDEDGLPIITDEPPIAYVSQQDDNGEGRSRLNDDYVIHHIDNSWEINVEKLFTDVFKGYDTLTGAALRYAVMTLGKIETRGMYNNCLNKAMNMGLMTKKYDSKNRRIYSLNSSQPKKPEPQQQELWKNGDPF